MSPALNFCAGLLVAYITILALRAAIGNKLICWILLLSIFGISSQAAINMRGRIVNTGSVTIWVDAHAVYNASNSDWPALNGSIAAGDDLPIDGSWAVLNNATATTGEWRVRYSTVGSTGPWTDFLDNVSPSFSSSASFQDYIMYLPAPYSYTNHVVTNACVTNFFATAANFWLEITEGGTTEIAGPHYLQPGEIYCTPAFTNNQAVSLQWVAYQSNDGFSAPTPVGDPTESTPQVESSETPDADIPPAIAEGSKDPFGDIPARENISTNEAVAARQNSEGIVRAIGESSDRQTAGLSNLFTSFGFGNLTLLTNLGGTNSDTAILQTISSNTAMATNMLSHLTNLATATGMLSQITGQASEILANDTEAAAISNFVATGEIAANSTVTNQSVTGEGSDSILKFTFNNANGDPAALNLDPLNTTGDTALAASMKVKFKTWMNFLRDWILKLLPFVMFWGCMSLAVGWMRAASESSLHVADSAANNLSPSGLIAGVVSGVIAVAFSFMFGFFPTMLVTKFEELSLTGAIPSLADHIRDWTEGGDMATAGLRAFEVFSEAIPFTSCIQSAVTYLGFRAFGEKAYIGVLSAFRAFAFVSKCVLPFLLVAQIHGASVRVINLDTNSVTWTNDSRSLAFPQGETLLNLEDTGWKVGDVVLDLDEGENEIVYRFSRNAAGELVADRGVDEGDWSWFWGGYKIGIVIFGAAWMVRIVRTGLTVPMRHSFSD